MNVIHNPTEHIYQYASFGDDYLSLVSLPVGSTRYSFASLPLVLIFTCYILHEKKRYTENPFILIEEKL